MHLTDEEKKVLRYLINVRIHARVAPSSTMMKELEAIKQKLHPPKCPSCGHRL